MYKRLFSRKRCKRNRALRAKGEAAVRDRAKKPGTKGSTGVPLSRPQMVFLLAALGTALLVLVTLFGRRGVVEVYALKNKIRATAEEISLYERRNKALQERIENLKEDPFTIEQIAREELGLVRPGETVYEFVDEAGFSKRRERTAPN